MATNSKIYMRNFMKKYYATKKGKAIVIKANKKYAHTDKGKASERRTRRRWTESGKCAEYHKNRRTELKRKGLCVDCKKPVITSQRCEKHRKRDKNRRRYVNTNTKI